MTPLSAYIAANYFRDQSFRPDMCICSIHARSPKGKQSFPAYYLHQQLASTRRMKLESSEYPANFFITAGTNKPSLTNEAFAYEFPVSVNRLWPDGEVSHGYIHL